MTFREFIEIASCSVYIFSHFPEKLPGERLLVQAWHGIPLKGLNFMSKNFDGFKETNKNHVTFNNADFVLSSSRNYEILMGACMGIPQSKFVRTGFPRNDYLFEADEDLKKIALELFGDRGVTIRTKIITYMPTYRIGRNRALVDGKIREGNIFGFDLFCPRSFEEFLAENDCVIIAKLHPFEEDYYKQDESSRIKLLKSDWLHEKKLDVYQILCASDMLITDYSSVFFDYLLVDRPIIFVTPDLEDYKGNRGFLLEPYESWTPGPKVQTQMELLEAIRAYLADASLDEEDRKAIKRVMFDGGLEKNNAERVWEMVIRPYITSSVDR